ncbi:LytR/AlgR family response regulator transcription factor [Sphingobacterium sp. SYP-B4668]|uniref:LytR/AlgR family response regulator transcription factor n=1 Tax=Sphingobacterium sp. SYP-B4668 TaxID=2996035 RepID=UPI0022DDBF8D|nr:LytTR family DNA-binding domain-containing protein [Sphingobacterium sp. SYP-B4668]
MISAIAIDDEPIALDIVDHYAQKVPFLSLEKKFSNALEAIGYLNERPIDLLFLDIKMPDISGIDFFKSLKTKPLLIFTTAYSEHAVTGFELEAIDYLLKPFSFPRFLKACNKASNLVRPTAVTNHIFVKDGVDMVRVDFDEILYLEGTGNYVSFVLKSKKILVRMTFKESLELLPPHDFIQIHRSYIVNIKLIDKLERHLISISGHRIPVSGAYLSDTKERLKSPPITR